MRRLLMGNTSSTDLGIPSIGQEEAWGGRWRA